MLEPMKPCKARGLTLIELAVILAVLAVLGSLAVPSLQARVQRERLHSLATHLASDLAEARFEAARSGRTVHVSATPGADWCWAVSAQPGCTCGQTASCADKLVRASEHPGMSLLAAAAVSIDAQGQVQGRLGARLASARGDELQVDLQPLGRARICTRQGPSIRFPSC